MLFKKKVTVSDYCNQSLLRLFSPERETAWEDLRKRCNDAHLNQADPCLYYDNLRAVMLELIFIAVVKNHSDFRVSGDAKVYTDSFLERRGLTLMGPLCREYNRAFGSSYNDGVLEMVSLFAEKVTQSKMGALSREQFYAEFYAVLQSLFDEFKGTKLIPA